MSFVKLQPENFDTFSLTLRPRAEFLSSSSGIYGAARLSSRPSTANKEIITGEVPSDPATFTSDLGVLGTYLRDAATFTGAERDAALQSYLSAVGTNSVNQKNNIIVPIYRLTQSIDFDRNSFAKSTIKNVLMPQYRSVYTDCDFNYKNYHSINFFTASTVPSDSAIIYPNIEQQYKLSNAFSFD